jgi:crossover junction endodeoxyribonuclease RusA
VIAFFVPGQPQTKGSAKAFVRNGKAAIVNDNTKNRGWAQHVAWVASQAMAKAGLALLDDVEVQLYFYLPRPKDQWNAALKLKPWAPSRPTTKPDIDKMTRSILDGLTGVVYRDDSTVTRCVIEKLFADDGRIGVSVLISNAPSPAGGRP